MSRIGKKPIEIPEKVKVISNNGLINIEGPLGKFSYKLIDGINVEVKDGKLFVTKNENRNDLGATYGTIRAILNNMVIGVHQLFQKVLEINGVGFKAILQGNSLSLTVGFSHPVILDIPVGLKVTLDPKQTIITISGIDKNLVGNFAAKIKKIKKTEPYKGTGIKYQGEKILRKAGKTAAAKK